MLRCCRDSEPGADLHLYREGPGRPEMPLAHSRGLSLALTTPRERAHGRDRLHSISQSLVSQTVTLGYGTTSLWDIATLSAPYRPNTSFDSIPYLISHHLSTISLNIAPSHQVDRSAPLKIYKTPAAGGPHITELIGHDHTLRFTKLKLCS